MTLEAESSVIKYSINRLIMDVGMKAYNHTSLVNNLMLRNIGKIHFDFELDVTPVVRPKAVRISPVIGHLRGSTRQRFNIRVFPCECLCLTPETYHLFALLLRIMCLNIIVILSSLLKTHLNVDCVCKKKCSSANGTLSNGALTWRCLTLANG